MAIECSGDYAPPGGPERLSKPVWLWWRFPLEMTAATRRVRRTGAKIDQVDALEIARIAAREYDLPPTCCAADTADIAWVVNLPA